MQSPQKGMIFYNQIFIDLKGIRGGSKWELKKGSWELEGAGHIVCEKIEKGDEKGKGRKKKFY